MGMTTNDIIINIATFLYKFKIYSFRLLKLILSSIKHKLKQLTCKHSYKWINTASGHHVQLDKYIVFSHTYECVKCGWRLRVDMDEEYQKENPND